MRHYFKASQDRDGSLIIERRHDDGSLCSAYVPMLIVTSPDYGTPDDVDADNRFIVVGTDEAGGFVLGDGHTETN